MVCAPVPAQIAGHFTVQFPAILNPSPERFGERKDIAKARSLTSDANSAGSGGIRIAGQATRLRDVFSFAKAFGRRIQNGWELNGKVSGDLRWDWSTDHPPAWNGHADLSQASLQMAGLNQPVQLESRL